MAFSSVALGYIGFVSGTLKRHLIQLSIRASIIISQEWGIQAMCEKRKVKRNRCNLIWHCQTSYSEGLGMSPSIMGLTPQDPYIQKEHTELYKIPTF